MARTYAGILGVLGLLTSLVRGFVHAQTTDATLLAAWVSLIAFAALGYVVGGIASRTVDESVRASLHGRLTRERASDGAKEPAPTP